MFPSCAKSFWPSAAFRVGLHELLLFAEELQNEEELIKARIKSRLAEQDKNSLNFLENFQENLIQFRDALNKEKKPTTTP